MNQQELIETNGITKNLSFKYDHIIWDADSTILSVEGFDLLCDLVLKDHPSKKDVLKQFEKITNLGMTGELKFNESLEKRMALLPSFSRKQVTTAGIIISDKITPSFLENKEFFTKYAKNIHLISGGFKEMLLPSTRKLGILDQNVHANVFKYDSDDRVIGFDSSKQTSKHQGKATKLKSLMLGGNMVVIGDGFTDYEMKSIGGAKTFIAYTEHAERPEVVKVADHQANSFEEILSIISN